LRIIRGDRDSTRTLIFSPSRKDSLTSAVTLRFLSKTITDYLGYVETSKEDLERWRLVLEGRHAWLAERGICYLFVLPPDKKTIYSEYLPEKVAVSKGVTRGEKLLAYIQENSHVPILDLRGALFEAKRHRQVYFSTDDHWNGYGIFAGYQQMILSLKRCLPELTDPMPLDPQSFGIVPIQGDLIGFGGLEADAYPEVSQHFNVGSRYTFEQRKIQDDWVYEVLSRYRKGGERIVMHTYNLENKLRAVFFHDSYMASMPELLARHFGEIESLWVRAEYDVLKNASESYHPDVVIDEVQERFLYEMPENHPEWGAARERCSSSQLAVSK
jgi:alginate O-acetyltransferase complex protein AlgJ